MKKKKTTKEKVAIGLLGVGFALCFTPLFILGLLMFAAGAFVMASIKLGYQKKAKELMDAGLLIPAQHELYVRGVRQRQSAIKKLPGALEFALQAEPTNKFDKDAVKVSAITPTGLIHVGYLPAHDEFTLLVRDLSNKLAPSFPKAYGVIEPYEDGLGITLHTCNNGWIRQQLKA